MGPSYIPCSHDSARFAQNAHCVTEVVRGWTKVPASYCFLLRLVPLLYAAKARLVKGYRASCWGEPNNTSWEDVYPGLAEVAVQFYA